MIQKFVFFNGSRRLMTVSEYRQQLVENERKAKSVRVGNGEIAKILTLESPAPARRELTAKQQQQVGRILHRANGGQFNFAGQPISSNRS